VSAGRHLFEGLASVGENSGGARFRLKASNNYINVERIEFDAAAYSSGFFGGDESRPGVPVGNPIRLANEAESRNVSIL